MFTCPRCGSHEFKTTMLPDGSRERECLGSVVAQLTVRLVKPEFTPRHEDLSFTSAQQPIVQHRHARRCTFLFPASDDGLYGVDGA